MKKEQALSPNFLLGEFLHPGIRYLPLPIISNLQKLAQSLETVRTRLGDRPIVITSGYRSVEHNKTVGGAKNSYHLQGMAADIVVPGVSPKEVQTILTDWPGGMGLAETFTHLDIRPHKTRFRY
ncbi:MAG: D-Ala-D-Ala carboxypeptidase family metallohydrolase [Vampirovibrionales bacterium]|nr:D-Ala-D-Ala carboxypeptidase family metallohydrolase [Vampirovibrionales bacterium]